MPRKDTHTMNNIFSKNGQLLPKARKPIYDKVVAELKASGFEPMPNGELVKTLGTIEGQPINAIVSLSISPRNDFEKRTKGTKSASEPEVIDVNELFD